MKTKAIIFFAALMLSVGAHAEWTVTYNSALDTWDVSDGTQNPIHFKKKKQAEKAAKKINKAESKSDKDN